MQIMDEPGNSYLHKTFESVDLDKTIDTCLDIYLNNIELFLNKLSKGDMEKILLKFLSNKKLVDTITKIVDEKLKLSDMVAEDLITNYILDQKKAGKKKISLFEIEYELGISEDQAEKILKKLEKYGVKEIV